ncbi:MAG TPA: choice-of-anchor D domain-containing protein [Terriglobales bacterium]|nr:choice-of-anchor D domain-containing protein [Terriglobales bacterium]
MFASATVSPQRNSSVCIGQRLRGSRIFFVFLLAMVVCCVALPGLGQAPNIINTVAGGGSNSSNPLNAVVPGPTSAISDAQGNVYIAPPLSRYVFELSNGALSNYAGQGYGGFGGDGGSVSGSLLGAAGGLVMDSSGTLFISDYGNSRIRMVVGGKISTIAGTGIKCADSTNPCGDGGSATAAGVPMLNLPMGIAVDNKGGLYIADSFNNRIRLVNYGSSSITVAGVTVPPGDINTIAGSGNACTNPTLGCGNGGAALAAQLTLPEDVAVDSAGNIFIADTKDQMVREIAAGSSNIQAFAGKGGACTTPTAACGDGGPATAALLHLPAGAAVDSTGNVYIADTSDHKIRLVNTQSSAITVDGVTINPGNIGTIAGTGVQGFGGDGGAPTSANLDLPGKIFVDGSGNMLVADTGNQRVRQIKANVINTIAGGGLGDATGTAAIFAGPYNLSEDSAGNIYIADQGNNRIRKVDSNFTVSTVVGTGSAGASGDTSSARSATLNSPSSIAIDQSGNLYIADSNNFAVRKVDANGNISRVAGTYGKSCFPTNSACGDGGPATAATFALPLTTIVDHSGNLVIADYFAHRIRAVNMQTSPITLWGVNIQPGNIATVAGIGTAGYAGNGGPAIQAKLSHPSGLAVDSANNLYISDQYNMQIRQVNASGQINAYALNTKACLCGDGKPALQGSMWNPLMIAIDPSNNLFISGGNDDVVQIVDAATQYYGTIAGSAQNADQGGFFGDGGPATQARMANTGALVDGAGNLWVSDNGNNRLRHVVLGPALTPSTKTLSFGTLPLNTKSSPQSTIASSSGGLDVSLSGITITGTNAGEFAQTNNCPAMVAPNRTCKANVTLTPTTYGPVSATLNFNDNAPDSPQTVKLTGSGPDFTLTAAPNQLTIQPGQSGSSTLTVTPLGLFNQVVTFTCSGAPANSQCSISPHSVQPDGIDPITSTLTLKTLGSVAPGTYTITATGSFSPLRHPATITVTIP